MIGLPAIRGREWLLEIGYRKRELFAYACEAYSRIAAPGSTPTSRRALLAAIESDWMPPDDRVDIDEYLATLHEAVDARNGWRRILEKCRPAPRKRANLEKAPKSDAAHHSCLLMPDSASRLTSAVIMEEIGVDVFDG
jgi:hypothetical protein